MHLLNIYRILSQALGSSHWYFQNQIEHPKISGFSPNLKVEVIFLLVQQYNGCNSPIFQLIPLIEHLSLLLSAVVSIRIDVRLLI